MTEYATLVQSRLADVTAWPVGRLIATVDEPILEEVASGMVRATNVFWDDPDFTQLRVMVDVYRLPSTSDSAGGEIVSLAVDDDLVFVSPGDRPAARRRSRLGRLWRKTHGRE